MYTIYDIDDKEKRTAIMFRFNGKVMTADNGTKEVEISREELESLVDWLKMNLEKMNRDEWEKERKNTCCDCVRPA